MATQATKEIEVLFLGRDRVVATFTFSGSSELSPLLGIEFKGSGCGPFLHALEDFKQRVLALPEKNRVIKGDDAFDLQVAAGADHSSILIRELVMRLRGSFKLPYGDVELCHCRAVPTEVVDRAIIGGCHTVQSVARMTSAGTSCGTCKPDTESLIAFRLKSISSTA
jgi:bacterioferritin-associated ferredoxin